jgi:N-acetylglutamate synthase-like GNAT family acetyltransferase
MEIRKARIVDLNRIRKYLDIYLRKDWFDTPKRLYSFIDQDFCWIAEEEGKIIGFAVMTNKGVMIRLLIHPFYRGKGIGQQMMKKIRPPIIRSKTDQSTGDPTGFYEKLGYKKIGSKVGRKKNIQLMIKTEPDDPENI